MFYNKSKSISMCNSYYDNLFMKHFNNKCLKNDTLYQKKNYSFIVSYPILYKKMIVFKMLGRVLKKKKMKNRFNLNQSILIDSRISRNKLFLQIPINCK